MSAHDSALNTAWNAALAAEHQAVFGYGLLGPRLSGADQQRAVRCSDAHEALRDATRALIAAAGLAPAEPQADYPALYPVPSAPAARRLALTLEDACATAWRFLYAEAASSSDKRAASLRTAAQIALTASAVRGVGWRAVVDPSRPTVPFPGIA